MANIKICDSCGKIIDKGKIYFGTKVVQRNGYPAAATKFAYCKQCVTHLLHELKRAQKEAKKQIHEGD